MMGTEGDKQMAAPAENENAQHAPSEMKSLLESADGSMATVATRRENNDCFTKLQQELT
jgi:hypothetical protein